MRYSLIAALFFVVGACLPLIAQETTPDACTINEKNYDDGGFNEDDFLSVGDSVILNDDVRLNTDQELDTENLVLGLDQEFFVDYLSEGAGASHLFGFFFYDIDTDKDGLPDFMETGDSDDLDGDGLVNSEDSDDDGDGIPDSSDRAPAGVTSMPANHYQFGDVAAAAGNHTGDYWQFVPNSVISGGDYNGMYEIPGAYLYVDNNANEIPDVLEYNQGANVIPPYVVDKNYDSSHILDSDIDLGFLGNWYYEGTPGDTVDDKYHWTGSTIFYIADDDGGSGQTGNYLAYTPYGTEYYDSMSSTNAHPDYLIYGTDDINSALIPDLLKNADGTAKLDDRGEELWRYRWYQSNVSGAREMVFFLVVFWGSGGSNVNTYYSKSGYNRDNPPGSPGRNGATNGDNFGGTGWNNWFPHYRNDGEHDSMVNQVWSSADEWTDIATEINSGAASNAGPEILSPPSDPGVTEEWIFEWENQREDRRIIQYRALADWFSQTAVSANTVINGRYDINMAAEGESSLIRAINNRMAHLMVGAPSSTKNAWLLGWEDLYGGGDRDYEDVVFYVKRKAGGQIQSLNVASDLEDAFEDFSLSQITFTFVDNFNDDDWGVEGRYINYYYRLGNADDWIPLLGGEHERDPDLFQDATGGSTTIDGGLITRTVTIQVENKKQEIYWKAEMATDNVDTFTPAIEDARVEYQSLVHDFYYNSAVIPNSNINYISSFEAPDITWEEAKNRGHLYAVQTFEHGNPPTPTVVTISPETTPETQPSDSAIKWDAGVSMKQSFEGGTPRTIYTYTVPTPTAVRQTNLTRRTIELNSVDEHIVEAFELSNDRNSNIWIDNYHEPDAVEQDVDSAALWLQNWIHGYSDPLVADGSVLDNGPTREWILGGINRASPMVIRPPGIPSWFSGSSIPVATKRDYLEFIEDDSQINSVTRLLIGTESGMLHCLDAGFWVGDSATSEEGEELQFADGYYEDFGTGEEVWAFLPGHLLDDIKYNYTGASSVTAKSDATGITTLVQDGDTWRRISVFSQGFKGGTQVLTGDERIGNMVYALDLTDIDNPIPMWHRGDKNAQDLINPPAMGWVELGSGDPTWAVAYSTGGTPIDEKKPGIILIDVLDGSVIKKRNIGSSSSIGVDVAIGTPALVDADSNGYVEHIIAATSQGRIIAYNTITEATRTKTVSGASFFLTPNVSAGSDGVLTVVAVTGDNPLYYDEVAEYGSSTFNNTIYVLEYDTVEGRWTDLGSIDLPTGHKAFSRPKLAGDQLVLGTTTGDTFNFCDHDPSDPGDLFLFDLSLIETEPESVVEARIQNFGSILAPIIVSDGRIFAHKNTSDRDSAPGTNTAIGASAGQSHQGSDKESIPVGDIFGVTGMQDNLLNSAMQQ